MAKKFIALEETSQAIKTTVEETKTEVESVGTAVNEIKEDVGDSAGTDLVARVANLATQVSNLQAAVEALASGGGGTGISIKEINTYTFSTSSSKNPITFTTRARAILLIMGYHADTVKLNISIGSVYYGTVQGYAAFKVNQGDSIILQNATKVYVTELQY